MVEARPLAPHEAVDPRGELVRLRRPLRRLRGASDKRRHLREAARRQDLLAAQVDPADVAAVEVLRAVAAARRVVHAGRARVLEPVEPVAGTRPVGLQPGKEPRRRVIGPRQAREVARPPRVQPLRPGEQRRVDALAEGGALRRVDVRHRHVAVGGLHRVEVVQVAESVAAGRGQPREERHEAAVPLPDDADARHAGHLRLPSVQLLHVLLGELDRLGVKLHPVGMRVQDDVGIGGERRQSDGGHEQGCDFLHFGFLLRK